MTLVQISKNHEGCTQKLELEQNMNLSLRPGVCHYWQVQRSKASLLGQGQRFADI